MIRLKITGMIAALALVSTAAYAFQEQKSAPVETSEGASPVAPAPLASDDAPSAKGTPVRIPGLGTLGVIPKMDFGLELLYGAASEQGAKRPDPSKSEQEDVLVGGRIKHKF